ncbi:hypothetical protein BDZ94DRAFT_1116440, partial [Collybia nuda]
MPQPGCREAPVFKGKEPTGLIRFLERMEVLWKECNITNDVEKKLMLGKYADPQSENEWRALDHYKTGTWAAFKRELISSYLEALDQVEGSVTKLENVCRTNPRIGITDEAALKKLKREFKAESMKLLGINPPIISNRELVTNVPSKFKMEMDEIKQQMVNLLDRLQVNEKNTKLGFEDVMKALQQATVPSGAPSNPVHQHHNHQHLGKPKDGQPQRAGGFKCHYCFGLGHFIMACPERQKHYEEGKIKNNANGSVCLPDGSYIPR